MDAVLNSAPLLVLILLADFAITSFHSYQEWRGTGAPLWRNFGAIVGLDISDRFGFPVFTVLLTLTLFAISYVGIIGPLNASWTAAALGALSFVLVLPGLWLVRWLLPERRRPAWSRWQPMPSWASAHRNS